MLEKTNVPGLVKNKRTGAVINTNEGEYEQILAAREKRRQEESIHMQIKNMAEEIRNLKELVHRLVGNK